MDNKDLLSGEAGINKDLINNIPSFGDHSQATTMLYQHADAGRMQREMDSLDDFERVDHDFQPLNVRNETLKFLDSLRGTSESPPRVAGEMHQEIDTGVVPVLSTPAAARVGGEPPATDPFDPHPAAAADHQLHHHSSSTGFVEGKHRTSAADPTQKMDSNLLEMGDSFVVDTNKKEEKIESFINDLYPASSSPQNVAQHPSLPPPLHSDNMNADHLLEDFMSSTKDSVSNEPSKPNAEKFDEKLDKFSDFPDNEDTFGMSNEGHDDHFANLVKNDPAMNFAQFETHGFDAFQDIRNDSPQPPLPKRDYFDVEEDKLSKPLIPDVKPITPEPAPAPEPIMEPPPPAPKVEELKKEVKKPEPSAPIEPPKPVVEEKKPEPKPVEIKPTKPKQAVIEVEDIFCKMGLDAWFNPQRLDPKVESLIYWRDPKISGAVFGGVLVVLLSLAYFSLISVAAHLSLLALTGTISFRIYKNILQAVQKTADGHPFKEYLAADIALPQEKVKEVTEIALAHINAAVAELRRLFLVEDLVDSIKFGVMLWCLTYLGAWFNGMTLIIIAFVALFTLPKVYETNKTQIDANLDIVRTKLAEITSKVKAAVPIGKKTEEKKEQ